MPDGPKVSVEDLEKDGFGEFPLFHAIVCEVNDAIVGYSMYFFIYSWAGKAIYIEDIIVRELYRGKGLGTALFQKVAKIAVSKSCQRLELSVLNWNTASRKFYESLGGVDLTESEGWNKYRFSGNALLDLAKESA
ncbi:thialysine N-epsilon-acetyltransferase-like isoform X4 [Artemia franciscana]